MMEQGKVVGLRIPIRGYELSLCKFHDVLFLLRIPIRGYEGSRCCDWQYYFKVTNPYKGL